jgi:tetratricopeptide (TPR) repeat protein
MKQPAVEKIYLLLKDHDPTIVAAFQEALKALLPYANINANLYLFMDNPLTYVSLLDHIFAIVKNHLDGHLFARLFVHLVHPVSEDGFDGEKKFYENLKTHARSFDQEGYMHQEVPRLMLLPLVVVDKPCDGYALGLLLASLRQSFLPPSLCVTADPDIMRRISLEEVGAEKIYWATGPSSDHSGDVSWVLSQLLRQDIVDDASARLASGKTVASPCAQSLIISLKSGHIFACLDTYEKKQPLGLIEKNLDVSALMAGYQRYWSSHSHCPHCRQRLALSFSRLPIGRETTHEIGALLYHFGTLHEERGQLEDAVSSYRASLRLSPQSEAGAIYFRLGLCQTMLGRYDEALAVFEKARSEYGETHFFHFYTALCLFYLGDYGGALKGFLNAEHMDPSIEDMVQILIYAGTCYNYLGEYQEALRPLEGAKNLDPSVKEVWSTLGFSYFQLKDFDAAIAHLKEAVTLDPYSAVDFASLGANYREKGDIPASIAMFEKALSLDPALAVAKENIERLTRQS